MVRADITGDTVTVSNPSMLEIDRFDAILNRPRMAILAVDAAAGAGSLATPRELRQA